MCFVILTLGLIIIKYYEETASEAQIKPHINLISASLASAILITILVVIIGFTRDELTIFHDPMYLTNRWIQYADDHFQNKKLFFFVIRLEPAYSLLLYSHDNIEVLSPWSNPWLLPYILQGKNTKNQFCHFQENSQIFKYLAVNSMIKNKPDFIIIESCQDKKFYLGRRFSYADFFLQDKGFVNFLKQYYLYGHFGEFTVYHRRNTNSKWSSYG